MARESAVKYPHSLLASYPIEDITGRTPFQLYDRDPVSKNVIDLYLKYVGELMVNVTNIFRSEAIIIGGGVSEQGSVIKDYVSAYIKNNAYGQENAFQPEILIATLKNKAGLLGAASMNQ